MKKIILVFCSMFMVVGLSACNTVQGLGKDVEKVGESIQKGANK